MSIIARSTKMKALWVQCVNVRIRLREQKRLEALSESREWRRWCDVIYSCRWDTVVVHSSKLAMRVDYCRVRTVENLYQSTCYYKTLYVVQHWLLIRPFITVSQRCSYNNSWHCPGNYYLYPKPPPLAAEPNNFLQAEKTPKNLRHSRKTTRN